MGTDIRIRMAREEDAPVLLDIFRPEAGAIRIQQQVSGTAGRAAWEMLNRVVRTVRSIRGF